MASVLWYNVPVNTVQMDLSGMSISRKSKKEEEAIEAAMEEFTSQWSEEAENDVIYRNITNRLVQNSDKNQEISWRFDQTDETSCYVTARNEECVSIQGQ